MAVGVGIHHQEDLAVAQLAEVHVLPEAAAQLDGPVVILYGLAPRRTRAQMTQIKEAHA